MMPTVTHLLTCRPLKSSWSVSNAGTIVLLVSCNAQSVWSCSKTRALYPASIDSASNASLKVCEVPNPKALAHNAESRFSPVT